MDSVQDDASWWIPQCIMGNVVLPLGRSPKSKTGQKNNTGGHQHAQQFREQKDRRHASMFYSGHIYTDIIEHGGGENQFW